jgi:hypothetical protein
MTLTPAETADAAELADLARAITRGIEQTPYRLGQPADDLASGIAVHVAAYLGRVTGDIPSLISRLKAAPARLRQERDTARLELHVLRCGLRAVGADPTQLQNLWAQTRSRTQQWRDVRAELATEQARIDAVLALPVATPEELELMDPEDYQQAVARADTLADVRRLLTKEG